MSFNYSTSDREQASREKVQAMRQGNTPAVLRLERIAERKGLSEDEKVELWRIVKYRYLNIEEGTDGYDKGRGPCFSTDQIAKVISTIKKWSDDHSGTRAMLRRDDRRVEMFLRRRR
ncbi:hypothetical protein LTR78_003372 [Recurvomyces mirabilis]|uniref:Uncharacterized protein n=1 Tax=Recurvomyces mirabilis TaxID=574656 RepID=A0AAE0WRC9_9PEZI|nr:hypothetical protein LTR78_003372 [Recurvomyces mirabilis]KAK5154592.1 hypothetical protein LTS14_006730 [Recurvomyces mirabilis]